MRELITGVAAFIGAHVADERLAKKHEVRPLDNLELKAHPGGSLTEHPVRRCRHRPGLAR